MMYVKKLTIDNLDNLEEGNITQEIDNPTWNEIESAIKNMDGERRSIVILSPKLSDHPEDDEYFNIGGGENGLYICFLYDIQGNEFALINSSQKSDQLIQIFAGEKLTRALNECVGLEAVLLASQTYAESGKLDKRFSWKEC